MVAHLSCDNIYYLLDMLAVFNTHFRNNHLADGIQGDYPTSDLIEYWVLQPTGNQPFVSGTKVILIRANPHYTSD